MEEAISANLETQESTQDLTQDQHSQPSQVDDTSNVADTSAVEGDPAAAVPNAYAPSYKFKVMDKELEFDEFVRGVIKDQDTEKKVRELYEKAHGLDFVKPRFQEVREKYKTLQQEYTSIQSGLQELSGHLNRGDLDSFFSALKIPQEKIYQFVLDKINYQGLPPEQKQAYDRQRELEQRAFELEKQNQQIQESFQQQTVQARTRDLDSVLARTDIKAQQDAFDARVGRPGAFREEVIRRGQLAYYTRGEDLTAEQAVGEVMSLLGSTAPAAPASAQMQPHATPAQTVVPQKPPVIPNVGGKSASPTDRAIGSIDDIKKAFADKFRK